MSFFLEQIGLQIKPFLLSTRLSLLFLRATCGVYSRVQVLEIEES